MSGILDHQCMSRVTMSSQCGEWVHHVEQNLAKTCVWMTKKGSISKKKERQGTFRTYWVLWWPLLQPVAGREWWFFLHRPNRGLKSSFPSTQTDCWRGWRRIHLANSKHGEICSCWYTTWKEILTTAIALCSITIFSVLFKHVDKLLINYSFYFKMPKELFFRIMTVALPLFTEKWVA